MTQFLKSLVTRGTGVSSMRWVFIWTYLVATVVPLGAWALVYVKSGGTGDVPSGVVTLVGLVVGAVTGGKVMQSREETKVASVASQAK